MKPNKSELVRNSSAEVSGFIMYGTDGKRAVAAAALARVAPKPLQSLCRGAGEAELPLGPLPTPQRALFPGEGQWGHPCSAVTAPQPPPKCTPQPKHRGEKPTAKLQNV